MDYGAGGRRLRAICPRRRTKCPAGPRSRAIANHGGPSANTGVAKPYSRQALKAPKAADQCRSGALDAGESCAGSEHCHRDVFGRFVHARADNLSEIGRPRVAKARISHRFCFGMRVALRLARQQCRPLSAAPPGLAARPGSAIVTECRSAQFTF